MCWLCITVTYCILLFSCQFFFPIVSFINISIWDQCLECPVGKGCCREQSFYPLWFLARNVMFPHLVYFSLHKCLELFNNIMLLLPQIGWSSENTVFKIFCDFQMGFLSSQKHNGRLSCWVFLRRKTGSSCYSDQFITAPYRMEELRLSLSVDGLKDLDPLLQLWR